MTGYAMPLYRPPSEGENLILQPTIGCSFNRCAFCSMYRSKTFRVKPLPEALAEIDAAALEWPEARRVFLADGDALCLPTDHLLALLERLQERLPGLTRVSCYATPADLLNKSPRELEALKQRKLTLLYYGIESGDAELLKRIKKGASPSGMAEGLWKAHHAGLKVSATVVLGLAGGNGWERHIDATAALLQQAPVAYLSTLQLHLAPEVEEGFKAGFDPPFRPQDDTGVLEEQQRLIAALTAPPRRIVFRSNHASNALALAGTLPTDRERLLAELRAAQEGRRPLRPHWLRGL